MKKNIYKKYLIEDDLEEDLPMIDEKINEYKDLNEIDEDNQDEKENIIKIIITKINSDNNDENDSEFIEDDFEYIDEVGSTDSDE